MNDVTLTPTDNGPYLVEGSITLLDAQGSTKFESNEVSSRRQQMRQQGGRGSRWMTGRFPLLGYLSGVRSEL